MSSEVIVANRARQSCSFSFGARIRPPARIWLVYGYDPDISELIRSRLQQEFLLVQTVSSRRAFHKAFDVYLTSKPSH
jgi:hypothetical protein